MMSSFAQSNAQRIVTSWPWYVTRASGIVAMALLVLLMLTGIGMFTGYQFKFMAPLKSWANHRTLGIALLVAVFLHIFSLLFDKFVSFNLVQLLVPFTSPYKKYNVLGLHLGSLWVALGILSFYLLIALSLASRRRAMEEHKSTWRITHYFSYIIVGFVFFHALMLGTDIKLPLWRTVFFASYALVTGFVLFRATRIGALEA